MALAKNDHGLGERSNSFSFIASSLLFALMVACVLIGLLQLGWRLDPAWKGGYLPWWGFFVTLEAIYSGLVIRNLAYTGLDWLRMRAVEFVVLVLVLKLLQFMLFVPSQDWLAAATWRAGSLFNGAFWLGFMLTLATWILAADFGEDLIQIYRTDSSRKNDVASLNAQDRMRARRRVVDKVLVLGALLIALTAFSRIDIRLIWGDRAPVDASYANLLLFFVFTLALFSQTQLATLSALWKLEEMPVRSNVAVRWLGASMLFLVLLAALIWFIPTFYAGGLFQGLEAILNFVIGLIWTLWGGFAFLLFSLLRLIGLPVFQAPDDPGSPLPDLNQPRPLPAPPPEWLEALKSVMVWVILLGIIVFAIYQYLQQNQELWSQLRRLPVFAWLGALWAWFRARLAGIGRAARSTAVRIRTRLAPKPGRLSEATGRRFTNPRGLTPRQQVLFYFMAALQKGEQSGVRRGRAQTPHEYARDLEAKFPEAGEHVGPLTESFIEARYSQHPIPPDRGNQARRWWQGLHRLLNRKKARP